MRLASKDQTAPAFVLGLGPNGYGQVRSLARAGITTLGFYYSSEHLGRASRFVQALPVERAISAEALAALLIETAKGFRERPVLFPASDEFAFLVSQGRERLAESFAFHWNSAEIIPKLFDKAEMIRFCQAAGILCPHTYVATNPEEIPRAAEAFTFPCLVKPLRSFRTAFPQDQKNYVAASPSDLLRFYDQNPDLIGATLWQEIIDGPDKEIYQCNVLVTKSGTVRAVCGVRKLRQCPPGFGNMCFGRTETNEMVVSLSLKLLHLLRYRGIASIEFKRRDDRYYFIELNARLPRYCVLLADAGVNLPYLGYLDLVATDSCCNSPRVQQKDDVYWLTAREDIQSVRESNGMRPSTLLSWIQSISRARSFAWWDRRDPIPFLRSVLNGRTLTKAHTSPIRSISTVSEFNDVETRNFFERQYRSPQQVGVGRDSFFIYDILPMRLKSVVPILFCPGWMENPQNHKETIYALYRLGRRTIFADSPHGIEPKKQEPYPAAELRKAEVLIATLRFCGLTEVDAIAHSEGAINLAIAATAETGPRFRNVVFHSPAGMCGAASMLRGVWRAWKEALHEKVRQKTRPTERQLLRDPQRRRMYLWTTLGQTIAEARAILRADIRDMLVVMRRQGTGIAVIHGADDRLFRMKKMQRNLDATMIDGFYSVEGGHQQILVAPSRHAHLAGVALLALEAIRKDHWKRGEPGWRSPEEEETT